jgi:hypothetical protein
MADDDEFLDAIDEHDAPGGNLDYGEADGGEPGTTPTSKRRARTPKSPYDQRVDCYNRSLCNMLSTNDKAGVIDVSPAKKGGYYQHGNLPCSVSICNP